MRGEGGSEREREREGRREGIRGARTRERSIAEEREKRGEEKERRRVLERDCLDRRPTTKKSELDATFRQSREVSRSSGEERKGEKKTRIVTRGRRRRRQGKSLANFPKKVETRVSVSLHGSFVGQAAQFRWAGGKRGGRKEGRNRWSDRAHDAASGQPRIAYGIVIFLSLSLSPLHLFLSFLFPPPSSSRAAPSRVTWFLGASRATVPKG